MNRRLLGRLAFATLLVGALTCGVLAESVQTPSATAAAGPSGAIAGGAGLFFPVADEVNEQIDALRLDMRQLGSELESLYGEDMSCMELIFPVAAGSAAQVLALRDLSPALAVGIELESLHLHNEGGFAFSASNKRVDVDVELSVAAGGGLAVLSVDSVEVGDLGPWSVRIVAAGGYYNATVQMEKQIQFHGIDEFGLRDEADIVDGTSAWGSKLAACVTRRIGEALTVEFSAAWRSLVFENVLANVLDPTEPIDLDLSGLTVSVALSVPF